MLTFSTSRCRWRRSSRHCGVLPHTFGGTPSLLPKLVRYAEYLSNDVTMMLNISMGPLSQQTVISGMQAVIRGLLQLEKTVVQTKRSRCVTALRAEYTYQRLAATGERLLEALHLENDLHSDSGTEDDLERWKLLRRNVERLVEQYLIAIQEWRQGIDSEFGGMD